MPSTRAEAAAGRAGTAVATPTAVRQGVQAVEQELGAGVGEALQSLVDENAEVMEVIGVMGHTLTAQAANENAEVMEVMDHKLAPATRKGTQSGYLKRGIVTCADTLTCTPAHWPSTP